MRIHLTMLYHKVDKERRKKEVELRNRLKHEGETHFPFRFFTVALFGIALFEALLRFLIILTHAPKDSFELFYKTKSSDFPKHDFSSFQKFHKQVRVFTATGGLVIVMSSALVGLALNFATGVYQTALAATYSWTQTNWNTLTSNTTGHPAPANWTEYAATSTSIVAGTSLSLGTLSRTAVDDGAGLSTKTDYATGATPEGVAISPDGTSVYVTNQNTWTVSMYARNTTTGTLSAKTDYVTGNVPGFIAISPDGTSVYVVNLTAYTVSMYARNTTTGTLSAKTDYATGVLPYDVTISSDGTSVYVPNYGSNTVSRYVRNTTTGALSARIDYPGAGGPWNSAISADGTSLYVVNRDNAIVSMYARDTTTGTLSAKTDYTTGAGPYGVAVSPDGTSVYTANISGSSVSMFARNTTTGTLSAKTDFAAGTTPFNVTVSSDGRSVYVPNSNTPSTLSVFSRNTTTGALSARIAYTTGDNPHDVAVSADGTSVYVPNSGSATVSMFNIAIKGGALGFESGTNASTVVSGTGSGASVGIPRRGILTALGTPTIAAGTNPYAITISTDGASAYVANSGGNVSMYSRNTSTGALTALAPATIAAGSFASAITISTDGASVYVANGNVNNVSMYSRNTSTGALTALATPTIAAGANPRGITISTDGASVYVANANGNTISMYSRNTSTGALTALATPTIAAGTWPQGITVSPDGSSVYVANSTTNNVSMYSRNTSTGALTALATPTIAASTNPYAITISPDGASVYVANYNGNTVSMYSRNTSTGALTALAPATIVAGSYPQGITVSPDGTFVYVANGGGNNVSMYSRNTSTGALTALATPTIAAGTWPFGITVSPDRSSVYVVNVNSNNVSMYSSNNNITSGTFTSAVIDTGIKKAFTTVSYSTTVPANTTITIDVRAGDVATPGGTWTAWQTNIASGGSISGLGSNRYVQYRANLTTIDNTFTPTLNDITLNYDVYTSGATLTSTKFNSGTVANLMGGITWNEDATLPSGAYIALALRSSSTASALDSTSWTTLTSTSTDCSKVGTAVTCLSSALPAGMRDGTDDQWFQYMVTLGSNGAGTPTLTDVSVSYVVNDLPELQNVTASEQSDGTVIISYETRDPDTSAGTFTPGFVAPSFEYSTDGGSTWTPIVSNLSAGATSSKAVSQTTWNTYGGTWTAKNVLNGMFSATTKIRVTVNDGETANNITQLATLNFTLDEKNPILAAIPLLVRAVSSPAEVTFDVTDDSALQMKIGRMSDLSDASWVAFAASTTITLVSDPDTVYAQFRDVNANQSAIVAVTTPQTPTSVIYRDLSNTSGTPAYRLFISWGVVAVPGPGFGNYRIYRSTDGSTYTLYATIADRLQNYLLDDNLDSSTTYYYKIYTDDVNGNTSYYSAVVSHLPNGQGGTDTTPPTITGVSSTSTPQTATINWTTDELSDSTVGFCTAPCSDYSTTQGISSFVTSHGVVLGGLTPGQTYNYSVTSRDPALNSASSTGLTFSTLAGPTISNVAVIRASNNGADITWDTDIPASAYVGHATNTPPSGGVESITGVMALNTTRTVTLTGLTSGQTYYFYVRSQDAIGNWAEDKNIVNGVVSYYKFNTSNDTAAPIITSVATGTVTDIAAVVSWITDEISNSTVEWGTSTGAYSSSTSYSTFDMTHFLELTGLSPLTTYYYHVVSADQSGNTATSSERTFTTPEEQFGASARIIQTNVFTSHRDPDGVSQILYDAAVREILELKSALANKTDDLQAELAQKTEELAAALKELSEIKIEVLGLKVGETTDPKVLLRIVTEKFSALTKVFEMNAALDLSESELAPVAQTLRDLAEAVPPPIIKGAPEIAIAPDRTTISWTSDKDTNSVIALARKSDYAPLRENPYTQEYGNFNVYTKEHAVALENLLPSTEYHFQIRSTSPFGTKVQTRDFTFNTPVQLPEISDAHIAQIENGKVRLSWHTNVLTNAAVRYTPFERGKPVDGKGATFGKPDYVNDHVVLLEQLKSGTTYGLELLSTDPYGNTAKRDMGNYTTGMDTEAPLITRVRSDITVFPGAGNKIQAIVFWETNELSTSQVFYDEGAESEGALKPSQSTQETIDMATKHTVVIANWKANTVYRFRVVSVDANGNIVESKDFTVKTPQKKASIIDIIVNNFSTTFSWTKNIGI